MSLLLTGDYRDELVSEITALLKCNRCATELIRLKRVRRVPKIIDKLGY